MVATTADLVDDYPRPQLRRAEWVCLDGTWDFALDPDARCFAPHQVNWTGTITVPFAPETPASGVGEEGYFLACWYRRWIEVPAPRADECLLLRFGAVDYAATVWVDGALVGKHEGGYTPFALDVTDAFAAPGPHEVVVQAEDDPHDLAKPRGKQDWQREPHSIWYPRTTGIWQTVWLERVPATRLGTLRWTSNLEAWTIGLEVMIDGPGARREDLRLSVRLHVPATAEQDERLLADDTYQVVAGEVHRRIALSDPGIDDFRNELLWSPRSPTLIRADLRLTDGTGTTLDEVRSYTALRSVGVQGDRFILNGRSLRLRMVLDQGYWPKTGLTAPNVDALRRDVELAKEMGFNGVRKHQKLEDPRYLAWADALGLLVWGEMPSAYRFTKRSVERVAREWTEALDRDISHPCIVAWVPFNESWGVPDLPNNPAQRDWVQALYHLTKTLDPSRPVIGNDGWESTATDIVGIHDYEDNPEKIRARYGATEVIPHLFRRERPGGRLITLEGHAHAGQPLMLTEFGGIAFTPPDEVDDSWGYARSRTPEEFARRYEALLAVVRELPLLAGYCYTQFADTYQEANGLLYEDRTPKVPLDRIKLATRGPLSAHAAEQEDAERRRKAKRGAATAGRRDG